MQKTELSQQRKTAPQMKSSSSSESCLGVQTTTFLFNTAWTLHGGARADKGHVTDHVTNGTAEPL